MTGEARIIRGNALNLPLDDESVDLVVTSPPYFALRSYRDGGEHYDGQIGAESTPDQFIDALLAATREMKRVLKPSGSIFVNLGDKYAGSNGQSSGPSQLSGATYSPDGTRTKDGKKGGFIARGAPPKSLIGVPWRYAIRCIDELGLILRAEIVWAKPNGLPESVTDRVRRSHEQWFHFTKAPRYFSAIDEIREEHKTPGGMGWAANGKGRLLAEIDTRPGARRGPNTTTYAGSGLISMGGNPLGKLPGSVWNVPTEPLRVDPALGIDHFAAFPTEWPRRIILGWSPSAICTVCGEGLRPVVEKHITGDRGGRQFNPSSGNVGVLGKERQYTITGYACACDTPGPTRPAVVLDPFSGTGTTAGVAKALGRIGIGVDMSADYCRLAEWRTNGAGYDVIERKVHERTYGKRARKQAPKPTESDDPTLFGDAA